MTRTKQFDPEERLDRAVSAFWENGFESLGVQQLCEAMDLFPGSLYAAFGGKRELFLKAVDRYMATHSTQAVALLNHEASGLEAIRAYFGRLIDEIETGNRKWGCLITNAIIELARSDDDVRQRVVVHLARLETAFAGAVSRGQNSGEIVPGPALDHAAYLACLVQGVNVLAKTNPGRPRLEIIVSTGISALMPQST
jgi:TetR/AcrR family transcriptional regulator, transcriptional repressor for nem operon